MLNPSGKFSFNLLTIFFSLVFASLKFLLDRCWKFISILDFSHSFLPYDCLHDILENPNIHSLSFELYSFAIQFLVRVCVCF